MDQESLSKISQELQVKKERLEKELSGFAKKDPNLKGDWDSTYPRVPEGNLEEAANEVEQYSTALPIEHSLELQLQDISFALERIAKGTYGTCENCKKEIPEARLMAMPEARFCTECSSRQP
ncbi:MAG: TraR/DksA C4-type zinc finger protein [Candidatus Wildermuthbacteria bacterium]|nr:TraR/DksA C4-type zinc finger protein [Candidatus Wildermuthbacteria bacterium]